ncbi:MAG: DNA ligase D [Rhodospirillaceae bacterium]|nr:DNA ligase D [Rhodospirillales bacterium]
MALEDYKAKRDFTRTPEPVGEPSRQAGTALAYVIQKHAARRLHFDFRLEWDGVLKSWAVPQGPSMDPGDKRLAVQVEDHPLDYGQFEGIIPKGQYGGGTVMLWDRGTWQPTEDAAKGFAKGKLKFRLDGERLKGGFTLVRMRGEGGKNWLLIKERDETAEQSLGDDVSVVSGRSMEEIAQAPERVWRSDRTNDPKLDPGSVAGARVAELPPRLAPMLASLTQAAPAGGDWIHEIKLDGYRLLARLDGGACTLFTRNGHDWTRKFPTIATACMALPCRNAWLDGEVVALDRHGVSRFHDLQSALSEGRDASLIYHLFDLVYVDGFDLSQSALTDRKELLRRLIGAQQGPLRYTDHLDGQGDAFQRQACAFALEGVVSKRRDRPYRPGRGKDWLKVKCTSSQEFVVAGWAPQQGRRTGIGALLVGVFDRSGKLVSAGRVGTGFGEREAATLEERLTPLVRPTSPFGTTEKGVTWVEPKLVIEVEFTNWTPDGQLRHPSYQGMRLDKDASEVVREAAGGDGGAEDHLANFHLTSPDKVLYPDQGLTKRGLAAYYLETAPWILPHISGRALTLVRCPDGAAKSCFYQRHPHPGMPKAIRRFPDDDEVLVGVEDVEGLIGLVQMGALEIHSWGSRTCDIERPDLLVFDLDPDEGLAWPKVAAGAREIKDRLAALKLAAFLKTTGGKGLHVVVPLVPRADWAEAKAFSKALAEAVSGDSPDAYTATITKARRKGRIFIDYLRNQRGATFIAPYSTRSRPGAPVAVPITWAELDAGIRSDHFTVETLNRRLASLPTDPWVDLVKSAVPLPPREVWAGL